MNAFFSTPIRLAIISAAVLSVNASIRAEIPYKYVGRSPDGQVAFEYVGKVKQTDGDFEAYGYITYIRDLPDEILFTAHPKDAKKRDEKNARFLFHSSSKSTRFSNVDKVFNVGASGELDIYIRIKADEEAGFDSGDSFKSPIKIANFELRGQSVITVTSENVGVNSAVFELTQKKVWKGFTIDETPYALGRPGTVFRFSHIGRGDRTQADPPIATISIAG